MIPNCKECTSNKFEDCMAAKCEVLTTFVARQLATKLRRINDQCKNLPKDIIEKETSEKGFEAFQLRMILQSIAGDSNIDEHPYTEEHMIDACRHNWIDLRTQGHPSGELCTKCEELREGNFEDTKFKPISEYGDLMTLQDFVECCQAGGFIDYDGHGDYVYDNQQSNHRVHPSTIMKGIIDTRFTHVNWYNR